MFGKMDGQAKAAMRETVEKDREDKEEEDEDGGMKQNDEGRAGEERQGGAPENTEGSAISATRQTTTAMAGGRYSIYVGFSFITHLGDLY